MLSYIVALFAFALFFSNPIYQAIWPTSHRSRHSGGPPQNILLNGSLLALPDESFKGSECEEDAYAVRLFSKEPLVLYVENFLSEDERKHLLEISDPIFEPSTITHDGSSTERDTSIRHSEVALLPRSRQVKCIEQRARALQGWRPDLFIERLRLQRYRTGGHYGHHFDWSSSASEWGRVSSFMVWVDASDDLVGGATEFPLLRRQESNDWCRYVECNYDVDEKEYEKEEAEARGETGAGTRREKGVALKEGVKFKVVPGNAVFWVNFDGRSEGVRESWHAGLPVEKGRKTGLNIWSFGRIE